MKFGQLIEYNRIFFLKNYIQNLVEKLFRVLFLKNQNWHNSGSIAKNFTQFVDIMCQVEGYLIILKLSCRPLAFTSCKAFLKYKDVWN